LFIYFITIFTQFITTSFFNSRIATVACGHNHSLLITSTGKLYSFGANDFGELGLGDDSFRSTPALINISSFMVAAAGGLNHSLALSIDGDVYAFGRGQEGQLGDGMPCSLDNDKAVHKSLIPKQVKGDMYKNPVILIAASHGGNGSYAVTASDGQGWYWGTLILNSREKTAWPSPLPHPLGMFPSSGIGMREKPLNTGNPVTTCNATLSLLSAKSTNSTQSSLYDHYPQAPETSYRIIALSAGSYHLVCVTLSGEAYSLGRSGPYLGVGPGCQIDWTTCAAQLLLPGDTLINGVSCGEKHTVLSTTQGKVLSCGDGSWGKLGHDGNLMERVSGSEAVPKVVELCGLQSGVVSMTIGEGTAGCEVILRNLLIGKMEKEKKDINYDFNDDDEDYWGEEGLGHELELDFNLGPCTGSPFGISDTISGKSLGSLGSETTKRLTHAVGGVILNTGGAVLYGVASAVKNRVRGESIGDENELISNSKRDIILSERSKEALVLGRLGSYQDSFDGLVGRARRKIVLLAGASHTCIHIVDDID